MLKGKITTSLAIVVAGILFVPFPTRVSEKTEAQFVFADGRPVPGLQVTQGWECFGLFGEGREKATTDASGIVHFPSRAGYGTVATRIVGRLSSLVAVHASSCANLRLDFSIDEPFRAVFSPPLYKPLEPFATSGSYLDSTGRDYFPQEKGKRQHVSISGDFMHNAKDIKVIIASGQANPQGGANGRQPVGSETNRTSAAAASRRSP